MTRTKLQLRRSDFGVRQQGFTLIELAIVVVMVAVLISLGLKTINQTRVSANANAEATELPLIVSKIQKTYSTQSTYSGVSLAGLIALNIFPTERVVSPTSAQNRWGGGITVAAATLTNANDSVQLTYAGVPKDECVEVIPLVTQTVRVITVNGTSVKADGAGLDLSALGTQCAGTTNSIMYQFTK